MSVIISNATIIDGVAEKPAEGKSIWIESGRIKAVARREELGAPARAELIDARGKYVIPGLMNANVHLFGALSVERLARHDGHFESIIAEAAQVALKAGLTTVFDTWGPRRFLTTVRDKINAGKIVGSRVFCAGNIIGFDGPFSPDFLAKASEVTSGAFARRVNSIFVENVGRHLMWLTPAQVAQEVRSYIGKKIDFVKYASNEHLGSTVGAFLAFSPQVQAAIVEEAHRAGLTAQAHTMSVEGLRMAVEAGCDLVQHANHTGPVPIPETTLELMLRQKTGAVVFPLRQRQLDWLMQNENYRPPGMWQAADTNTRNLIRSGARLLLGNDGNLLAPEAATDPKLLKNWGGPWEENLFSLSTGHFTWLEAMEEKGCPPMQILKAATHNIAVAYGKDKDLGSIQPGKCADMLILDKDPLEAAENYRRIHMILKDGLPVDRNALPAHPILTAPVDPPAEEEDSYIPFIGGGKALPMCALCDMRLD